MKDQLKLADREGTGVEGPGEMSRGDGGAARNVECLTGQMKARGDFRGIAGMENWPVTYITFKEHKCCSVWQIGRTWRDMFYLLASVLIPVDMLLVSCLPHFPH